MSVAVCCCALLLCEGDSCVLQFVACVAAVSGQRMCFAVCCCSVSETHVSSSVLLLYEGDTFVLQSVAAL